LEPGEERYRAITRAHYRRASGVSWRSTWMVAFSGGKGRG